MRLNEQTGARGQVKGWQCNDVVFELHNGQPHVLPKHSHATFQIGTTTREPGEYLCDGKTWYAPPGSMMVFHPGQIHSAPKVGVRSETAVSKIMFVDPARMRAIASDLAGRPTPEPHFDDLVIRETGFITQFCRLHSLVTGHASVLEKESYLLAVLTQLILTFGSRQYPDQPSNCHGTKICAVRDYVESNYSEPITLAQLAEVAHISPCHLNRVFSNAIGMPPHAFQTQVRVERAKPLLLQGMPATEVAMRTGFFDQSHFTRHFRRIVGVPPRSYVL